MSALTEVVNPATEEIVETVAQVDAAGTDDAIRLTDVILSSVYVHHNIDEP